MKKNYLENLLKGEKYEVIYEDGSRFVTINDHDLFGYCRYHDFYKLCVESTTGKAHFVEVGSFFGQSSAIMSYLIEKYKKDITFDCVDLFEISNFSEHKHEDYVNYFGGDLYKGFIDNLTKSNTLKNINKIHKMTSLEAAKLYEDFSLEMVYLDASHTTEDLIEDIKAWWPKLKVGGLLAGDDWDHSTVPAAVMHCFKTDGNDQIDNSGVFKYGTWFVKKNE